MRTRPYRLFLNSGQWKRLRAQYRRAHPLCERCEAQGRTVLAQEVHHKQPCGDDVDRQLSWENLESICSPCHIAEHAGSINAIDDEGYPISPHHLANRERR